MARRKFDDIIEERRAKMDPDEREWHEQHTEQMTTALLTGYALQVAREDAGVTQAELARRLGTAQSAISRLEAGRTRVTVEYLAAVASALGDNFSVRIGRHEAKLSAPGASVIASQRSAIRRSAGKATPKRLAAAASSKSKTKSGSSGGKKTKVTASAKTGGSGRSRTSA